MTKSPNIKKDDYSNTISNTTSISVSPVKNTKNTFAIDSS